MEIYYHFITFQFPALFCPTLAPPANGTLNTDDVSYGSSVVASCLDGFMYPDRVVNKTVHCQDLLEVEFVMSASWDATYEDCIGGKLQIRRLMLIV